MTPKEIADRLRSRDGALQYEIDAADLIERQVMMTDDLVQLVNDQRAELHAARDTIERQARALKAAERED